MNLDNFYCEFCGKHRDKSVDHSVCSKKLQEKYNKPKRLTKNPYTNKRINHFLKFLGE